jgi:hypothetical protein
MNETLEEVFAKPQYWCMVPGCHAEFNHPKIEKGSCTLSPWTWDDIERCPECGSTLIYDCWAAAIRDRDAEEAYNSRFMVRTKKAIISYIKHFGKKKTK